MAPVGSLAGAAEADEVLMEAGWELVPPELDQRPWRRMYVMPNGDRRLAHLHPIEREHPRWREVLLFRDRLRQDPNWFSDTSTSSGSRPEPIPMTVRHTQRRSPTSSSTSSDDPEAITTRLAERRADDEFRQRLRQSIEDNQRILERLAE